MVNQFINDICSILGITKPVVTYDTSRFPTDATLAQCSPEGDVIFLRKFDMPNPDQLFAIAHELRHVWQINTDRQTYLLDYKPADMCENMDEYNLQDAEIDANAFAMIVMSDFFGAKPLFVGLSDAVKQRINERAEEISAQYSEIGY